MNEKVLILLNTTILTENTELGDEGGVKIKKADEVSSADGCDGLGGCSHNPVAENLSYNKIYFIKLLSQKKWLSSWILGLMERKPSRLKKKVRHKSVAHPFM